jgi:hypothetical protein
MSWTHDDGADPVLRQIERGLLVRRAPRHGRGGSGRTLLVGGLVARVAEDPDAARVDEGPTDTAAQKFTRRGNGLAVEVDSRGTVVLGDMYEGLRPVRRGRVAGGILQVADDQLDAGSL